MGEIIFAVKNVHKNMYMNCILLITHCDISEDEGMRNLSVRYASSILHYKSKFMYRVRCCTNFNIRYVIVAYFCTNLNLHFTYCASLSSCTVSMYTYDFIYQTALQVLSHVPWFCTNMNYSTILLYKVKFMYSTAV